MRRHPHDHQPVQQLRDVIAQQRERLPALRAAVTAALEVPHHLEPGQIRVIPPPRPRPRAPLPLRAVPVRLPPAAVTARNRALSARSLAFSSRSSATSRAISRFASSAASSTSRSGASAPCESGTTSAATATQHSKHHQKRHITHHAPRVSPVCRHPPPNRLTTRFPNTYDETAGSSDLVC